MSIDRSRIYFVNLNPVQGREQAGQRPVLVVSIDQINRLPLVVTVAVTATRSPSNPKQSGSYDSSFDRTSQRRTAPI
ncbi:MAG: type II toxin-antitoxin system PemK/MazF family toxin [Leptolyngbyaceae cyanobacterium SM1_3_5]|nr:type II toxin-antitoxin system PemK/MazF family toxin [Leptolyngbyaceae cyanobacterium SM1_3_5]